MGLLINKSRRKQPISILSNDLIAPNLAPTQTVSASDIVSSTDAGMNRYLNMTGVIAIQKEYNEEVRKFEDSIEEQAFQFVTGLRESETSSKLQAATAADSAANRTVEATPGLGTGASAIASEGRQQALGQAYSTIDESIAKAYQEGMTSLDELYQEGMATLNEAYMSGLESVLGKYDADTGTFSGLANYEMMGNAATTAMAKILADLIDPVNKDGLHYTEVLKNAGYLESTGPNGEIILSDKAETAIDSLINGSGADELRSALGGRSIMDALAEQMGKDAYSATLEDGTTTWESLSPAKRAEIVTNYASWLYNNQDMLRVTHWDLFETKDGSYIPDITYSTSAIPSTVVHDGVHEDTGIRVTELSYDDVSDCTEKEFNKVRLDLTSGKVPNGAYITFQQDKASDDDKFYYYYDGTLYKTDYTAANPPETISVNRASIYSFGNYHDTGTGRGEQDEWIQQVIDTAKAGRIPDGAIISMNYGMSKIRGTRGYYRYEDGVFYKVEDSALIELAKWFDDSAQTLGGPLVITNIQNSEYIYGNMWNAIKEKLDW